MYQKEGNCISRVSTESFIPWRVVYDNQYCHSFLMIFSVLCLTLNTSTCLIFNLALLKQFSSTFTEEAVLFAVTVDAIQYPRANELSDSLWSIGLTQWSIYSLLRMMAPSFYDREECIAFWSFCLLELLWFLLTFLHKKIWECYFPYTTPLRSPPPPYSWTSGSSIFDSLKVSICLY